jgi:hypothetical protein
MNEPLADLSRFILICVALVGPVAWMLAVILKRRAGKLYDAEVPSSPGEVIDELRREFPSLARTVIRTHTEYLPLLFERIRETIDEGFDDAKVISLLDRIDRHRPGEERRAVFTITEAGKRGDMHLRWTRDGWDRIELHIQASPSVIRELRRFKRHIPKALPG